MSDGRRPRDEELMKLYQALAHPVRSRIIRLLAERGKMSFTELRTELKVSVGTLYYNLDQLRGFITQDVDRKYMLTERGKLAYEMLKRDEAHLASLTSEPALGPLLPLYRALSKVFLPGWLEEAAMREPILYVLASLSLLVGILLATVTKLKLLLLFYHPGGASPVLSAMCYVLSWLGVAALCDGLSLIFHGSHGDHLRLLLMTAVSLLPLSLYPLAHLAIYRLVPADAVILGKTSLRSLLLAVSMFSLLGLTLGFLTVSVRTAKKLETERAFVVVALTYYLCFMLYMLLYPYVLPITSRV